MEPFRRSLVVAAKIGAASLLLSACGGGRDSSAPPPNLNSAAGAAAINAYFQASHSNTLTATDSGGNTWQVQVTFSPNAGTTTFNGTANASSAVQTLNVFRNGAPVTNSVETDYFLLNPFMSLGGVSTTGITEISSNTSPVPTTISVGQSGPLGTTTIYHDSTLATVDATRLETFSVQARDSSTLFFCVTDATNFVSGQGNVDGFGTDTESDCYAVDASGNASLAKIVLILNMPKLTTLTFQ